ncbi:MAG: NUDIX hydrolase [Candidatus Nanopelagicales bacterium]|jgi:8-oxo-dGTP diphosphatase|nr:NUDIX hydrolase [Candidatus Nanopelagicales bacterium]
METDGNGWVACGCGHRHWGKHGAAGLFLQVGDQVLVQLRPGWAHQGGSWAIPGGARDSHESVLTAAMREAHEEAAIQAADLTVEGVHRLQHPDWRYDTVIATAAHKPEVTEHAESVELRWVSADDLRHMHLHPGFAQSLPELLLPVVTVVVDAANVVGSTPDGWWNDRVGATRRLADDLEEIAGSVVQLDGQQVLVGGVELVVEGQAVGAPDTALDSLVSIVRSAGVGDDMVVARSRSIGQALVVTSDRGLRARVDRPVSVSQLRTWMG